MFKRDWFFIAILAWVLAFGCWPDSFAQSVKPIFSTAKKNVTIIYNSTTGQPLMVVVDADNLADPSFNPPNTTQVSVTPQAYNAMNTDSFVSYMNTHAPVPYVAPAQ